MPVTEPRNVFDDLNAALTVQIDKLQSADLNDKEHLEALVDQSRAVAELADNINRNTRNAIAAVKLQHELSITSGEIIVSVPKLLKGADDDR